MSARAASPELRILVWGPRGSGKTSFITGVAYAGLARQFLAYDEELSTAGARMLDENIDRLLHGLPKPIVPTASQGPVRFKLASGRRVVFTDVRGEMAELDRRQGPLAEAAEARRELFRDADGVLFVFDPTARGPEQSFSLLTGAMASPDLRRAYMSVTKCEQLLAPDDRPWSAYCGWWRDVPAIRALAQGHEAIWEQLGERVWPISLYGYAPGSGKPAALLNEFGDLCPWQIQPKNVLELVERMVSDPGLAP